jgi:tripartite-type tricarboxylate transporter receptor subunit TctC
MKGCLVPVLLGLLLATPPAAAQDWPSKPVKIIMPFGAGSTPT